MSIELKVLGLINMGLQQDEQFFVTSNLSWMKTVSFLLLFIDLACFFTVNIVVTIVCQYIAVVRKGFDKM